MKDDSFVSDERLNAFFDGELTAQEMQEVLQAVERDSSLAQRLSSLRHTDDLLRAGYGRIPEATADPVAGILGRRRRWPQAAAAVLLIGAGTAAGWVTSARIDRPDQPVIADLSHIDSKEVAAKKVLLNISTMDAKRINAVLSSAETFLRHSRNAKAAAAVEILAHGDGLGMLRQGSPYERRIRSLSDHFSNVSFRACGVAMKIAQLKEHHAIELIPEAKPVDAALEEILRRMKQGWMYVRG